MAEDASLNLVQCGFESHLGHMSDYMALTEEYMANFMPEARTMADEEAATASKPGLVLQYKLERQEVPADPLPPYLDDKIAQSARRALGITNLPPHHPTGRKLRPEDPG